MEKTELSSEQKSEISLSNDEKIWTNAKTRFMGEVAYLWIFSNTFFFLFMIVGIVIITLFDGWLEYVGVILALYAFLSMCYRRGLYVGYFDGYEHGYIDCQYAQKRSLRELSKNNFANTDVVKAYALDVSFEEMGWSEKDKEDYTKRIEGGFKKLKIIRWF